MDVLDKTDSFKNYIYDDYFRNMDRKQTYKGKSVVTFDSSKTNDIRTRIEFQFKSKVRKVKDQRLLYNIPTLVSSFGGALGIFVGISFLGIFVKCLNCLEYNKLSFSSD